MCVSILSENPASVPIQSGAAGATSENQLILKFVGPQPNAKKVKNNAISSSGRWPAYYMLLAHLTNHVKSAHRF